MCFFFERLLNRKKLTADWTLQHLVYYIMRGLQMGTAHSMLWRLGVGKDRLKSFEWGGREVLKGVDREVLRRLAHVAKVQR